ncbi:MAG: phospholipase D-like domain-containing protein [Candidatus Micrarchaeales archaeon]
MFNLFKTPSYSGRDTYRYVERVILKGRKILIVSPYIDQYYANFILRNLRGRSFNIVSSSMDKRAQKLLTKGKFPTDLLISSAILSIADAMLYYLEYSLYGLYLTILIVVMIAAVIYLASKKPTSIHLKVPKEFVHAKLYISENIAVHGSVNLTYKGLHKNVEHVEMVDDPDEIAKLERQFWDIWKAS